MRRFWRDAAATPDGGVALDGRPVRTPGRAPLLLPTPALAALVAAEWAAVGEVVDPREMPLTSLANAAVDRIAPDPAAFAATLARWGESDLLCYRADAPAGLVERQRAAWDPLLAWAAARYDAAFTVVTGIGHAPQPAATLRQLGEAVGTLGPFPLAGLSPLVTVTGSLIAALAVLEGHAEPEAAWAAGLVDEEWQAERWGRDPLAAAALAARRRDFDAGAAFLAALG